MNARLLAALTLGTTVSIPGPAGAQIRASEPGIVAQIVDGTTITIEYSRPVARGRPMIFGGVVRWNEIWTPGANWATTIEVDRDIRIDGREVPRGKYSIWMIPREREDWTVVFSNRVRAFHTQHPKETDDLVRFNVKPVTAAHTEVLTWSFPAIATEGVTLRMEWSTTSIPLHITVQPTRHIAMEPEKAEPYVGRYAVTTPGEASSRPASIDIRFEDGRLIGRMDPPPPGEEGVIEFLPAGEGRFHPAYIQNGRLFEVDAETIVTFTMSAGRAVGFEFVFDGSAWLTGRRTR